MNCHCNLGMSARAIAYAGHKDHPWDPSDLRRCLDYMRWAGLTTSQLRERMAGRTPQWDALLPHWDDLALLLAEEMKRDDGSAPATYARMKEILDATYRQPVMPASERGDPVTRVPVLVVLRHVVQAGRARVGVPHRNLHVPHGHAADQPRGAEGPTQAVRRDVAAAGRLANAGHEASGVLLGHGLPGLVEQQRPGRPVAHDLTDGTHDGDRERDAGGLAAFPGWSKHPHAARVEVAQPGRSLSRSTLCRACSFGHPNECENPTYCGKEPTMTTPAKYRKKPVVIEAFRLTEDNGGAVAGWCGGTLRGGPKGGSKGGTVIIHTLEGSMTADVGDYVIRGVQGEHYPCKPDIFDATYEAVDG
jgi:hypothetical protein